MDPMGIESSSLFKRDDFVRFSGMAHGYNNSRAPKAQRWQHSGEVGSLNLWGSVDVLGWNDADMCYDLIDVSKNMETPKWIVYNGNPFLYKVDDLGVPLFLETSICLMLIPWKSPILDD